MKKRILLGVDAPLSQTTQYALRTVSELLEYATNYPQGIDSSSLSPRELHVVLLNVISLPHFIAPSPSMYMGPLLPMTVTQEQRGRAEDTLRNARTALQKHGIALERIEMLIRRGSPTEEIVEPPRS